MSIIVLLPSFNFCCLAGLVSMEEEDPDFWAMPKSCSGSKMKATAHARMSWLWTEVASGNWSKVSGVVTGG